MAKTRLSEKKKEESGVSIAPNALSHLNEFFEDEKTTPGTVTPGMSWLAAGVIMGMLLSMAFGLDLFELFSDNGKSLPLSTQEAVELQKANSKIAQLEGDIDRLKKESSMVASDRNDAELKNQNLLNQLLGQDENSQIDIQSHDELIQLVYEKKWREFQIALQGLLRKGDEGFDILLSSAKAVVTDHQELLADGNAAWAINHVLAQNDLFVANFIQYGLSSPVFNSDPAFAEKGLYWSSLYFANSLSKGQTIEQKSALTQKLEKSLELGDLHILVVLECMEILGLEAPLESLAGRLEKQSQENSHGMILTFLGEQDREETVEFLIDFLKNGKELPSWKLELALEMLAKSQHPRAKEGLKEFMQSTDVTLRQAAHYAYFSVARKSEEGLGVLVQFLNAEGEGIGEKRHLLNRARFHAPEVFKSLAEDPEQLTDTVLKEELKAGWVSLKAGS